MHGVNKMPRIIRSAVPKRPRHESVAVYAAAHKIRALAASFILFALFASASRATSTSRRWRHAPRHRRDAPRRCCTCSKQFPHRRMNGAPVKSYEDLVSYLLAKDPRIKKTRLDFEGRNACLYFRP